MFDKIFHVVIEILIFIGLVFGTLALSKFGFDYLFKYLEISPFSKEAYDYVTIVYSFLIGVLILKIDLKYRAMRSLKNKNLRLMEQLELVRDEEHEMKENIIKVIS